MVLQPVFSNTTLGFVLVLPPPLPPEDFFCVPEDLLFPPEDFFCVPEDPPQPIFPNINYKL
jgi:hypothetical protein